MSLLIRALVSLLLLGFLGRSAPAWGLPWVPAPPATRLALQEGCGPYQCRLIIYGQTTCWDEGSSFATPCCDFLCVCDPDGLDCGWEL